MTEHSTNHRSYSDLHWSATDGLQIAARHWSVDSAIGTVLVIHGVGDHSGRFEQVANTLNTAGYSVMAPDMRGHGRSEGKRGYVQNFDILINDIEFALQKSVATNPGKPSFIYGHSMGALASLYFAMKKQPAIDGLIVTSPPLRVAMAAPPWKVSLGKFLHKTFPRVSVNSGLDLNELSDDPQVAERVRSDRYCHRRVTPGAYFGMLEIGKWCLQNPELLLCPTLLMHGKLDRITDHTASLEFAVSAKNCSLRIWDVGKHELHNMTFRADVMTEITRFQSRCTREDSPSTD